MHIKFLRGHIDDHSAGAIFLWTPMSSSRTGHNYQLACIVSRRRDTRLCKEKEWAIDWCFRGYNRLTKNESNPQQLALLKLQDT
jgi:hypothetical protein